VVDHVEALLALGIVDAARSISWWKPVRVAQVGQRLDDLRARRGQGQLAERTSWT
jgi:hypothetical protein